METYNSVIILKKNTTYTSVLYVVHNCHRSKWWYTLFHFISLYILVRKLLASSGQKKKTLSAQILLL